MNDKDISDALGQWLAGMVGVPAIVWENKAADPEAPYLRVEMVRVSVTDPSVAGHRPRYTGYMMVSIMTALDGFDTSGLTLGAAIRARFPYGLRLTAGDGQVTIMQPATVLQGYRDGELWRTPVRVPYEAV